MIRSCARAFSHHVQTSIPLYDPVQLAHMAEPCIAVTREDVPLGPVSKSDAHKLPNFSLHRAFSVFAFTPDNKLIMQKRSEAKITFPSLWTNTCCSHPLYNDDELDGKNGVVRAAIRKLNHELGITDVKADECVPVGRYLYQAKMNDGLWGEHELDYVVILRNLDPTRIHPNPEEVSDIHLATQQDIHQWVAEKKSDFTPWFLLLHELKHLDSWWKKLDEISSKDYKPEIIELN